MLLGLKKCTSSSLCSSAVNLITNQDCHTNQYLRQLVTFYPSTHLNTLYTRKIWQQPSFQTKSTTSPRPTNDLHPKKALFSFVRIDHAVLLCTLPFRLVVMLWFLGMVLMRNMSFLVGLVALTMLLLIVCLGVYNTVVCIED